MARRPRFVQGPVNTVPERRADLDGRGAGTGCRSLHADNAAEGNRRNDESIFNQILISPSATNYCEASVSGRIRLSHSAVKECDLCRQEAHRRYLWPNILSRERIETLVLAVYCQGLNGLSKSSADGCERVVNAIGNIVHASDCTK